jgi:hypothetical protein
LYLNENPKALTAWTGFVVALHLTGETERALSVLEAFLKTTAVPLFFLDQSSDEGCWQSLGLRLMCLS